MTTTAEGLRNAGLTQTAARRREQVANSRWLALGLVFVAAGLAAVAALGPLVGGVVEYRVSETLRNQTIGLDAVSLVLVAPLAVAAAALVLRGRVLGFALSLGIGAYTSYMSVQYVLGPDYAHRAGNNERLFPLALGLFAAGWLVALGGWRSFDAAAIRGSRRRDLLLGRVVVPLLALLAFIRYLPALADAMSPQPSDGGYLAGPSFFWAIALLDLGVFLPATVAVCVGLVRDTAWARKALLLVAGWFGLVGPAVAAMAITMSVNEDPNASGGSAALMTALGLASLALALWVFWPLFSRRVDAESIGEMRAARR